MLIAHPQDKYHVISGRILQPGEVLLDIDVYSSTTGMWELCPCPGAKVEEHLKVVWVRPALPKNGPLLEQNRPQIMPTFNEQKLYLRGWLAGAGMHKALRAVNLGLEWHDGTRKDGVTPEFSHQLWQIQYVRTLAGIRDLETVIVTIALHDLPEDKRYDIRWVRAEFGDVEGNSVEAMSKKFFGKNADKSPENYHYQLALDEHASVGKGADRVHNQSTMPGVFTLAKMEEFMVETEQFVLPMLKQARKNFPHQGTVYSGLRVRLKEQIHLIRTCCNLSNNPGVVDIDPYP